MVPPQRRRRRQGGELAERREADEREDERAHGYAVRLRARGWRLAGGAKACSVVRCSVSRLLAVVCCSCKGGVVVHFAELRLASALAPVAESSLRAAEREQRRNDAQQTAGVRTGASLVPYRTLAAQNRRDRKAACSACRAAAETPSQSHGSVAKRVQRAVSHRSVL